MLINAPVVDLWKEPNSTARESQLLYGEPIEIDEEQGEWVKIRALEQLKCLPDGAWTGYPGWIERKYTISAPKPPYNLIVTSKTAKIPFEVLLGTRLHGIKELPDSWIIRHPNGTEGTILKKDVAPQPLIPHSRQLLGYPYLWGGRSLGIDCSGFVGLMYRIQGKDIPRDAHDQFLRSTPCERNQLIPGDLVFMANEKTPHRMCHVMMYTGDGNVIEATSASGNIRELPLAERPLEGYIVHYRKLSFS